MSPASAIVVGAGPVGMSCALALRARNVEVTVLEADLGDAVRPGSRAIYVHRASLQLLERIRPGLGREIAADGLVWPEKRTFWRGREVFCRNYPPPMPDRLPPFTSLPQTAMESHLARACREAGVEVVRGAEVEGLATGAEGIEVASGAGGRWAAPYLVGADGARSAVRRGLSIPMEGSRSENAFVVADLAEDPDQPTPPARLFHYRHPAVEGRNVLLVPFAGGWRVDLQCRSDDDPSRFASEQGIGPWIAAVLGRRYAERVTWVSTYHFLQVVAQTFADVHRRAVLIGDAAHLFAPFGARGMNSGIADASAAAEAIAVACRNGGRQDARLAIEQFADDRRSAAIWNREAARQALAVMQSRRPKMVLKRGLAAAIAPWLERAGAWLDTAPYGPRLRDDRRGGY